MIVGCSGSEREQQDSRDKHSQNGSNCVPYGSKYNLEFQCDCQILDVNRQQEIYTTTSYGFFSRGDQLV